MNEINKYSMITMGHNFPGTKKCGILGWVTFASGYSTIS